MSISSLLQRLAMILTLGAFIAGHPAYGESGGVDVRYEVEGDTLTINARSADLITVLMQISRQTDIKVLVDPEVTGTVTASFSQRPMKAALSSILHDFNVITLYARQDTPEGQLRVSELRVLPQGKTDSGMLRPIEALQQDDIKQQRLSRFHENWQANSDKRVAIEKEKLEKRWARINALEETNPELYEKKMRRFRMRYPEFVGRVVSKKEK